MSTTNAELDKIAKYLKDNYSDDNKTGNGKHTKYSEVNSTKMDNLTLSYKPNKGLSVKTSNNVRLQMDDFDDVEEFENIVENFVDLKKLSKKLPASKQKTKLTKIKSI